jgi:4'-phosphopantetheinyl transferase
MTAAVFVNPDPDEVRIYLARPGLGDAHVERALAALLEEPESVRGARLLRPQDRIVHRLGHALLQRALRGALGRTNCPLTRDDFGRPELAQAPEQPLWFNLSHTAGMVVCALAHAPVGIDVEVNIGNRDWHGIAARFFHPDELSWIERAPTNARHTRFTTIWTLKEAVVKAAGRGLTIPLNSFAVDPDGCHPSVRTDNPELAGVWWLEKRAYSAHHLGLALRNPAPKTVILTECTAAQIAGVCARSPTVEVCDPIQNQWAAA